MPRIAKGLTPSRCDTLGEGTHADGRGLYLTVQGGCRSFVLRYTSPSIFKRRWITVGDQRHLSLRDARNKADDLRQLVRHGIDPLGKRQEVAAEARAQDTANALSAGGSITLQRFARDYHERAVEPVLKGKTARQWIAALEQHLFPVIGQKALIAVTPSDVLDVVAPLTRAHPAVAKKIRQRGETIYADAILRGVATSNPFAQIRKAPELRAARNGHVEQHFKALPFVEIPALVAKLRELPGTAACALEFAILTASRTGEVLAARWDEFNADLSTWTVPAHRIKGRDAHTVALSASARAVLKRVRKLSSTWCFPSPAGDQPLSNMGMLVLLRRMEIDARTTVHGLARTSFSTWSNESGAARPDVVEACLAHRESDLVRRAYNRAKFQAERAKLLADWAKFLR
jgi:integrase